MMEASTRNKFIHSSFVLFCGRCVVPPITISTPILDYGRCFLHHPYELPVHLSNDSDLPAKYELLSQVLTLLFNYTTAVQFFAL